MVRKHGRVPGALIKGQVDAIRSKRLFFFFFSRGKATVYTGEVIVAIFKRIAFRDEETQGSGGGVEKGWSAP